MSLQSSLSTENIENFVKLFKAFECY